MVSAVWLVILPLIAVPVLFLLRHIKLGAILGVFIVLLLAWLTPRLPVGVVSNILGRPIELTALSQTVISLLFVAAALLFVIPLFCPIYRRGLSNSRIEKMFYPVGMAVLGVLAAANLSRHLGITAIAVEVAAILTVFIIQGERLDSTRSALRFLTVMSLITPLFLLAAWRIDLYLLTGGHESAASAGQTIFYIGVGFAFFLAVVPFHGWLISTTAEAAPVTAAFVLITFPTVAFSVLLHLLAELPWLVDSAQLVKAIVIAGVLTALIGGILAAVQRNFSQLMGYSALYQLGEMLAVLGVGGPAAVLMILVMLVGRVLALVLMTAGLSAIRMHLTGDGFTESRGLALKIPAGIAALLVGGFTLAGLPFTVGFAPHRQLLAVSAALNPTWSVLLTLGGLGVAAGYLRGLYAVLKPGPRSGSRISRVSLKVTEPPLLLMLISFLVIVSISLGLFPALLIDLLQPVADTVIFPIQ